MDQKPDTELYRIAIETPGPAPAGHMPVLNFYIVKITTAGHRMQDFHVVLPLPEVLDALKALTITPEAIEVNHPAFSPV